MSVVYPNEYKSEIQNYLKSNISPEIKKYSDEFIRESGGDSIKFPGDLSVKINSKFKYEVRDERNPLSPCFFLQKIIYP
ncbi:MAG: hypothetical protein OEV66_05725 [Spirochaetia bacterium]|nr:hypothetical protein [Spirochaetia bacterium]